MIGHKPKGTSVKEVPFVT